MPSWLTTILQILLFVVVFLVIYNQLKIRLLSKFRPNRWVILAISLVMFFVPTTIASYYNYNLSGTVWQYVQSTIFMIFFLWFLDLRNGAIYNVRRTNKKQKDIEIRPKAKPNRAKKK